MGTTEGCWEVNADSCGIVTKFFAVVLLVEWFQRKDGTALYIINSEGTSCKVKILIVTSKGKVTAYHLLVPAALLSVVSHIPPNTKHEISFLLTLSEGVENIYNATTSIYHIHFSTSTINLMTRS